MIGDLEQSVAELIRNHASWAPPIVFALAFGESLAFVSLLLPSTAILLVTGGAIGAVGIALWPVWLAAVCGAVLGDCVSYWLGYHYQHAITRIWPFTRHPELLERSTALCRRWGMAGVFIGRFFGPLRAFVPLVAGLSAMPQFPFQIANVTSAAIWASGILMPGLALSRWLG